MTLATALPTAAVSQALPTDQSLGDLQIVARFNGPMPTGVTVSKHGRIFLNFPRWGDHVDATVAEWVSGQTVAFPRGLSQESSGEPSKELISVQSVVVDQKDRFWILDTGRVKFLPAPEGGPKLIGVDLVTNKVFKTVTFPPNITPSDAYLNDVRFDYTRGAEGTAYITDSSDTTHGIIVVDLATGKSWKRLTHHPSTAADPSFQAFIEGRAVLNINADGKTTKPKNAVDGIALSGDHKYVYYCALFSRHLYRVSAAALADARLSDSQVESTVEDLGDKGMSDGMESDSAGKLYFGDLEGNSVREWNPSGTFRLIAHDPRILWADTFSLANDGYLYFTANQLHRSPSFHGGVDLRSKPYVLFRIKIDGHPIS